MIVKLSAVFKSAETSSMEFRGRWYLRALFVLHLFTFPRHALCVLDDGRSHCIRKSERFFDEGEKGGEDPGVDIGDKMPGDQDGQYFPAHLKILTRVLPSRSRIFFEMGALRY